MEVTGGEDDKAETSKEHSADIGEHREGQTGRGEELQEVDRSAVAQVLEEENGSGAAAKTGQGGGEMTSEGKVTLEEIGSSIFKKIMKLFQ